MSLNAIDDKFAEPGEHVRKRKRRTVMSSDAIVAIAMELFERQGFDRTTVDEIAIAAGVSKRTIFRHFEFKATIVLHPIRGAFRTLPDILAATPRSLGIERAMRLALETLAQAMDQDRAMIVRHTRMIATSPELRAAARSFTDAAMHDVRLEIGARSGKHLNTVRTAIWAELMLVVAFGGRDCWLSSPEVSIEAVIDHSMREVAAFAELLRIADAPAIDIK